MADDEQPRIVATFDSYAGMLEAIRARVNELQVNGERLDEYVGLPREVAGAKPIRRLGMTSFAPILNGLGLKCQFVENQEATERLKSRVPPRKSSFVRGAPSIVLTVRYFKRIGRKGAQARVDNSTKEQRQEWARKAAIARWRGPMIAPFNTAGLNVRFTPKSGHWDSAARCPLCAISGCEQVHQIAPIQSTSSLHQ